MREELGKTFDLSLDEELGTDELALRRLLHGAVDELEPSQGALDHLRRAVPARRARKRQAVVGLAAAALFVGMAVPAFVHVANSGGAADDRPSIAGHGQEAQGGTGWEKGNGDSEKVKEKPSGKASSKSEKEKRKDKAKGPGKGSSGSDAGRGAGGGTGGGADAPGGVPASSPTCGAGQLSAGSAGTGAADAEGKVYGTFRISNVSATACTVAGSGGWGFQTTGAADSARIGVVDHTSGDAATGLPDPSLETTGLLLEPGAAYEVKFAWVPSDSCPTTGTPPDPTPTGDPAAGGTTVGGTGPGGGSGGTETGGADGGTADGGTGGEQEQTGTDTQLGTEDGGTMDGSVTVIHTPGAGGSSAAATIPNACAGTIYRTGVLAAS
ncbi:hypothetical protein AS594_16365 [Streptomyces agglomeratus]|uniref:DUF4232 domain-containing protein n=1 Tax=Streptomyces agglomeratus TaxID=285458 RepID=A0A1E5PIY6_9ACTN|nr:hypothetical protein AS594_16365 [Streptomyces agglomeratus]OEJ55818.1 hypothetical protein BGK72_19750 [Streptomyces agglomeratus]